jgi:RNA-directed DNA polymerase
MTNNPALWTAAYAKISANDGATTRGIDSVTQDGFSDERAKNIMALLKEARYTFKPARRTYIPKADGRKRPLGLPSGDDKLVQEVARALLARIYEGIFKDTSHGFRPARSCHTALEQIRKTWSGVNWIIEFDIKGYFDNIDHEIMVKCLEKRIDDRKFIKLTKSMLKAGYMEDWTYHRTYSGAPQGGIISPILANIYLNELDEFIQEITTGFNKGKERIRSPKYRQLEFQIAKRRKTIDRLKEHSEEHTETINTLKGEIATIDRERKRLPSREPFDTSYKRLRYCRYADDFVLGIIGSKQDAEQIFSSVKTFLKEQLKLEISETKSKIRYSRESIPFLGYEITVHSGAKVVKTVKAGRHTTMQSMSQKVSLLVPQEKIMAFCKSKAYGDYDRVATTKRSALIQLSDAEIISTYNAELRGFANYYRLAYAVKSKLNKLYWIAQGSMFKTLAAKHTSSIKKEAEKLRAGKDYILKDASPKGIKELKVWKLKDLKTHPLRDAWFDDIPDTRKITMARVEITKRLYANRCEYCGKEQGYVEVHHVRKLKDLKGKELWQYQMIARRRKTMVLCIECHKRLHAGKLQDWRFKMYSKVESAVH